MTPEKISHIFAASVDVDVHLLRPLQSTWDATLARGLILVVSAAKPLLRQVRGIHTRKFTLISLHMSAVSVELVLSGLACCGGMSSWNIRMNGHIHAQSAESSSNCRPCWEVTYARYIVMIMNISVQTARHSSSFRVAWRSTGVPFMISRSHTTAVCVTVSSARLQTFEHIWGPIRGNVHFSVQSVDWPSHTQALSNLTCDVTWTKCRCPPQSQLCSLSNHLWLHFLCCWVLSLYFCSRS